MSEDRTSLLAYAAARVAVADELPRLGWAASLELRDAARALRDAGELALAVRAAHAALVLSAWRIARLREELERAQDVAHTLSTVRSMSTPA